MHNISETISNCLTNNAGEPCSYRKAAAVIAISAFALTIFLAIDFGRLLPLTQRQSIICLATGAAITIVTLIALYILRNENKNPFIKKAIPKTETRLNEIEKKEQGTDILQIPQNIENLQWLVGRPALNGEISEVLIESNPKQSTASLWLDHGHIGKYINYLAFKDDRLSFSSPRNFSLNDSEGLEIGNPRSLQAAVLSECAIGGKKNYYKDGNCARRFFDSACNENEETAEVFAFAFQTGNGAESASTNESIEQITVGNHWTLVLVDKSRKKVIYFDPKHSYGQHNYIIQKLNELTTTINQEETEAKETYSFSEATNRSIQPDGHQCGIWILYFLEAYLQNPDVDFNKLQDPSGQVQQFRMKVAHILNTIQQCQTI